MLKSDQNWDFREYFALHQQQIIYQPGTAILPDVGWSISKIRPLWATWEWRQKNVSQRQLLMPGFYTPFLEAINSLSSQRPHTFAILTDFLRHLFYQRKTRLTDTTAQYLWRVMDCYRWTDVLLIIILIAHTNICFSTWWYTIITLNNTP